MSPDGREPGDDAAARHQLLTRLVGAARRLEPPARAAFLDAECAGDDPLRREVESYVAEIERSPVDGIDIPEIRSAAERAAAELVRARVTSVGQSPTSALGASGAAADAGGEEPPVEPSRLRSGWFWLGSLTTVLLLALFVYQGVFILRHGGAERVRGWSSASRDLGWEVSAVTAGGPADGRLEAGDRILEVAGMPVPPSRWTGPGSTLQWLPVGQFYPVTFERAGARHTVDLLMDGIPGKNLRKDVVDWLVGLSSVVVGALLILGRPRAPIARLGAAALLVAGAYALGTNSNTAGINAAVALPLSAFFWPANWVLLYHFFARFPVPIDGGRTWSRIGRLVTLLGIALWLPVLARFALRARILWSAPGVDVMRRLQGWEDLLHGFALTHLSPAAALYTASVSLAAIAVMARNYRGLPEGDARRRVRLVAVAVAGVACLWLVDGVWAGVTGLLGAAPSYMQRHLYTRLLETTPALVFIALGYALLKHRVLDLDLTLRAGIRHLLARNVLRLLVGLPLGWLAYAVGSRPDRTVGELVALGAFGPNMALLGVAGFSLTYRESIARWIDRRFFREAYDQERVLLGLIESIKQRDSIPELLAAVSREIDAALHVDRILVYHRGATERDLILGIAADGSAGGCALSSAGLASLCDSKVRLVGELDGKCSTSDLRWLRRQRIEVVVPAVANDGRLVALLLLGAKKSEQPYTARDRELLLTIGSQLGSACEVIALRERVDRDRRIQHEVLDRLGGEPARLLLECPRCGRCADHGLRRCPEDGDELRPTLPVERTIDGKYRLERRLGRGGMGAVYVAADLRLGRPVAVKVMLGSLFGTGVAQRRFAREARAAAQLDHPGIVRVHDYGPLPGDGAYLVLELCPGQTWDRELRRRGRFPPAETADLIAPLLDAIAAAHAAGVVHRDLKPANILLLPAGDPQPSRIKVLDFGLAKVREVGFADPKSETAAGERLGTMGYMSPEQYQGQDVDPRTDIYAIGVLTLVTLTGPLPAVTPGYHQSTEAELGRRLAGRSSPPDHRDLARILARCLAFDRERRYRTVTELQSELVPSLRRCSPWMAAAAAG